MERNENNLGYTLAKKRIKVIKGFYIHLTTFVFVIGFILLLNTQNKSLSELFEQTDYYVKLNFLLWGIFLFIHWALVFGSALLFGREWEKRKLQELMEKEKNV